MILKLSQDRKVQGVKGERNSFGLPAIVSCPGATDACKAVCYATKGMFTFRAAKELYADNYKSLRTLLAIGDNQAACFLYNEIIKHNKSGLFRWNIGGDIFSEEYLKTIVKVAEMAPSITFWVYTRSFDILRNYVPNKYNTIPRNLKINLSFDRDNIVKRSALFSTVKAPQIVKQLEWLTYTITYMGDINIAKRTFPDRRWITCPETSGRIELQSACANCKLCFGPYDAKHTEKMIRRNKEQWELETIMQWNNKDFEESAWHANKEYGREIGIHFPTNKFQGRK